MTRDDAIEGVGCLRAEWQGGVSGVLVAYEVGSDTVTIAVDFPSMAKLTAPRCEFQVAQTKTRDA